MIQLSLNDIRKASNELSFKRGVQYYQSSYVSNVRVEQQTVLATVNGNKPYEVAVYFQPLTGIIDHFNCTCPAYSDYSGACKHIVASMFHILYTKEKLNANFERSAHDQIFSAFSDALNQAENPIRKEQLKLELTLEISSRDHCAISLRIGLDKLYVLKSLPDFFSALTKGHTLSYGQKLTFDPRKHGFDKYDHKVLDLLKDYYEIYQFVKPMPYGGEFQNNNKLLMPESLLKKLLKILEHKAFILKRNGTEIIDSYVEKDFAMDFDVVQDDNHIAIQGAKTRDFYPLTKDYAFVLLNDQIYHLDSKKRRFFSVLTQNFTHSNQSLKFDVQNKQKFINSVLPVLKSLGDVHLDSAMTENLIIEEADPQLFIDRYKDSISIRVSFIYGSYNYGIFPSLTPEVPEPFMVVRDEPAENRLMNELMAAGCVKQGESFLTLESEDRLYSFIFDHLPVLQKMANIFYSDDFKNLHVKPPAQFGAKVRFNEQSELLEFSFETEHFDKKELSHVLAALNERKKYYRLRDGSFLQLEDDNLVQMSQLIHQLGIKPKELGQEVVQLPKYKAFTVDHFLKTSGLENVTKNEAMDKLIADINEPSRMHFRLPGGLNAQLRNYQKLGYKWFRTLCHYGFGGILADDMGLGKTLQSIALLKSLDPAKQSLVVAPTSLVYNWEDEIHRFAPDIKVCVIRGDKKQREEIFKDIDQFQVLITSYGLLKRDLEVYGEHPFEICMIDEAQHIKNPNSLNAKAVKKVKAKYRFALTGTPIENALTELWSIFDFIMPGYLSTHSRFIATYEKPIIKGDDLNALNQLTGQINPFILRRLKTDVLKELPPKIETKLMTELTDKQKKLYMAYLEKIKTEISQDMKSQGYGKSTIKILSALTRLRQICCHPALFADNYTGDCAKLDLLEELVVDAIEAGHRILIFSQFTTMLGIIRQMLDRNDIHSFYLDGATPAETRRDMVNLFNAGENEVFLISLKAGGTGLNLTGADMVIHYDPWWNPATEEQATDRAYRIGQDKPVQVMRLLTSGTIEEKIFELQQRKKSLIESIIQPGETLINKLTEEEVLKLFEL